MKKNDESYHEYSIEGQEVPMTFKDFSLKFKWPTVSSLYAMYLKRGKNGLSKAFLKYGRRSLVLPLTLFKLLKDNQE